MLALGAAAGTGAAGLGWFAPCWGICGAKAQFLRSGLSKLLKQPFAARDLLSALFKGAGSGQLVLALPAFALLALLWGYSDLSACRASVSLALLQGRILGLHMSSVLVQCRKSVLCEPLDLARWRNHENLSYSVISEG